MAGIWDRMFTDDDRIPGHLLTAAIYLAARGVFTDAQVKNAINAQIVTPLDSAAETDLLNIKSQATTGSATNRLDYMMRIESLGIAVESGALTNESLWRSEMGIA